MHRAIVCAWLLCPTLLAQNQKPAPAPALLEKLYRLVWPVGRFNGDLVRTVSKNTQKGGSNPDAPRLYLVNARTGIAAEWKTGLGAIEPVVCAADHTLFYRRGQKLAAQALRIESTDRIESSGGAVELNGPPIGNLVACTADGTASFLWVQADDGGLRRMVRKGTAIVPVGSVDDAEFAAVPPRALADYLRIIPSMRPDGFTAAVINNVLVGERPGQGKFLIVDSDSLQFSDVPAWVPDTDSLFVTGMKGGPQ